MFEQKSIIFIFSMIGLGLSNDGCYMFYYKGNNFNNNLSELYSFYNFAYLKTNDQIAQHSRIFFQRNNQSINKIVEINKRPKVSANVSLSGLAGYGGFKNSYKLPEPYENWQANFQPWSDRFYTSDSYENKRYGRIGLELALEIHANNIEFGIPVVTLTHDNPEDIATRWVHWYDMVPLQIMELNKWPIRIGFSLGLPYTKKTRELITPKRIFSQRKSKETGKIPYTKITYRRAFNIKLQGTFYGYDVIMKEYAGIDIVNYPNSYRKINEYKFDRGYGGNVDLRFEIFANKYDYGNAGFISIYYNRTGNHINQYGLDVGFSFEIFKSYDPYSNDL